MAEIFPHPSIFKRFRQRPVSQKRIEALKGANDNRKSVKEILAKLQKKLDPNKAKRVRLMERLGPILLALKEEPKKGAAYDALIKLRDQISAEIGKL